MELSKKWDLAYQRYRGTMRTFARNSVNQIPDMDIEDIVQELTVVLWECTMKYDPNRGASFNTLFQGSAKNKIITLIRRGQTQKRTAVVTSLDDDAVRVAVDSLVQNESSEDHCLRRMELDEAIDEYGMEALFAAKSVKRVRRAA